MFRPDLKVDEVFKMIKRFLITGCTAGFQSTAPLCATKLYFRFFFYFWIIYEGGSDTALARCPTCVNRGGLVNVGQSDSRHGMYTEQVADWRVK